MSHLLSFVGVSVVVIITPGPDTVLTKMAAFFTSLIPQFAPAHGAAFLALLPLGITFSVLTMHGWGSTPRSRLGWVICCAAAQRHRGATGLVLIALGIRIAAERSP